MPLFSLLFGENEAKSGAHSPCSGGENEANSGARSLLIFGRIRGNGAQSADLSSLRNVGMLRRGRAILWETPLLDREEQ